MADKNARAWICLMCGYVEHGDHAPETCPICGAPATDFELHATSRKTAAPAAPQQWRCLICGYTHTGNAPPDTCPVCGASADDFEPCEPPVSKGGGTADRRKIMIVGGGIAGLSAAEAARQAAPEAEITLVCKERELPYYRLNLTRFLAGEVSEEELLIHPQTWYDERRITLQLGTEATAVYPDEHRLTLNGNDTVAFDKLVLACGAHPFIPPIPGATKDGVTAIRTKAHVQALLERIVPDIPCVCIGGGILGLETAGALAQRGAQVTLLEGFGHLLPRQLNPDAARVLEAYVNAKGIRICAQAATSEISGGDAAATVRLEDGTALPAAIVSITTGVRANSHLARGAGLAVDKGVMVNTRLTASHPDIHAAGDIAEYAGESGGLWEPARYQGSIAGMNAAGITTEFGGMPRMNTLKVLGVNLFSIGAITPEDGSYVEIAEETDGVYRRFLFHDNRLAGAILIGDTSIAATLAKAMRERSEYSALLIRHPNAREVAEYMAEG